MIQIPAKRGASFSKVSGGGLPGFSIIGNEIEKVRELMDEQHSDCSGTVREMISYADVGGGKMLRPAMVLLSGLAVGKLTQKHIVTAAIIELLHNATLLHDDVLDDGKSRRGKPTINALMGNEPAVLLGDFLLSKVFKMSAGLDLRVMGIIAAATAKTCEGEIRQIAQRGNWVFNEREYLDVIAEKTAALFEASCMLGAIQSGASRKQEKAIGEYGRKVGIAFQITDDLLDLAGDRKKTGKAVGNDLDKNKMTLPVINFLQAADKSEKGLVRRVLSRNGDKSAISIAERKDLLEKLKENGCLSYASRRAGKFIDDAVEAISVLKPNKATKGLIEISRFVVERTA